MEIELNTLKMRAGKADIMFIWNTGNEQRYKNSDYIGNINGHPNSLFTYISVSNGMNVDILGRLLETSLIIRDKVIKVAKRHRSSHVGGCLSCVELMVYLYYYKMKKEDIFILSKGHAGLTQYCILNDKGMISKEELWAYPKKLGIHPEINIEKGIYATTGSLGHGVGIGLGYAIANRDRRVYVLISEGDLDEGSTYEALGLKGKLGIENLIVVVDRNGFTGYEEIKIKASLPDGHNFEDIDNRFNSEMMYPLLEFKTVKGKGLKRFENELGGHYWSINDYDYEQYQKGLFQ